MAKIRDLLFTPLALIAFTVATSLLASLVGDASLRRITIGAVVSMIAVIGIFLFTGMTGVFSFGQLAFMAIGAYTTAILSVPTVTKQALFKGMPEWLIQAQLPFVPAVIVGGLVAAVAALLLSAPMARMKDLPAGLATLAILVTVYVVAGNWSQVTNGSKGMSGVPPTTTLLVALIAVGLVIILAWAFKQSGTGLRIQATREDAIAARAIGIRVGLERGKAFVASGLTMGLAGGLYAQLHGNISPDAFYLAPTFLLIAMLVVGGLNSLTGAVLGTIVITVLQQVLREIESGIAIGALEIPGRPGLTEVGLGVALLLILALRTTGLTRGQELTWQATTRFFQRLTSVFRSKHEGSTPKRAPVSADEEVAQHVVTGTLRSKEGNS